MVFEVPRESGRWGYGAVHCLNDDGSEIACIHDNQLWIYNVRTGKRIHHEKFPPVEGAYFRYLAASGDKWIVGSEMAGSRIIDLKEGSTVTTMFPEAMRASPIRARDKDCLLVESQSGNGGIIELATGAILDLWYVGTDQGGGSMPEQPPRAYTTFDGKLLVRRNAHGVEMQLMDLQTLEPIAEIYPMPVGEKIGWIIATSDGYWDASPGAEEYVAFYIGRRDMSDKKETRRKPQLIKGRIAKVIARPRK